MPHFIVYLGFSLLLVTACSEAPHAEQVSPSSSGNDDAGTGVDTANAEADAPADTLREEGDGVDEPTDTSTTDSSTTDSSAGEADATGVSEGCDCQIWEHCDAEGVCVEDLCDQGTTTCAVDAPEASEAIQVCNAEGSAMELVPCAEGEVCHLGVCQTPVCEANATEGCEGGQLKVCNSVGTGWSLIPCPGGSACLEGECVPLQPNVILLMDTSGSMNAVDLSGTLPAECTGDECPPWTWPSCDVVDAPQTRLGKAKKALQAVLASEEAQTCRLALQRFPQKFDLFKLLGQSDPTCEGIPLIAFDLFSKDNATVHNIHQITELAPDGSDLAEIMPVPFNAQAASTTSEILRWVDFEHVYENDGEPCQNLNDCSPPITHKACIAGECASSLEPELRAMGKTPLGRALFYAGEIYRHTVVVEGRSCESDTECYSPHYTCVEGACRDPFRSCRPNLIVLFSDGAETLDTDPELFFHARNQAKRLHYGLGCESDADCLNGATCVDWLCTPPTPLDFPSAYQVVPETTCYLGEVVANDACDDAVGPDEECCLTRGVCRLTSVPCGNNFACSDYPYPCGGSASTCSGRCEEIDTGFADGVGQDVLRDPEGTPFSVTVHVVDAAGSPTGTSLVAAMGGGQHALVDLDDLDGVLNVFTPLLDVKANTDACP